MIISILSNLEDERFKLAHTILVYSETPNSPEWRLEEFKRDLKRVNKAIAVLKGECDGIL